MPNPWSILAVVVAFVVAVSGAYLKGNHDGVAAENLKWIAATEKLKDEAAQTLAAKTQEVLTLQQQNDQLAAQREKDYVSHQTDLDKAYADGRRAVATAGGLRDPGAGRGNCGGHADGKGPAGPVSGDQGASRGGALSEAAQRFLFDFAREADQLVLDIRACQDDDRQLRSMMQ